MRPTLRLLSDELIKQIVSEAINILCTLGIEISNERVITLLTDHGAKFDKEKSRLTFTEAMIEKAIASAPGTFKLFDTQGNQTHNFSDYNVHFTPGSAALNVLDHQTQKMRKPTTRDYVDYVKVVSQLENIAAQSTAFIPADVPNEISDSYRLFLSLLYCDKPVVTGTFSIESFAVMKDFQLAVRGTKQALREKPLSIFSCCPTSPLKWSNVTSENVVDCAQYGIPVEFIAMPLSGFVAPVTLTGTLVQHTAETLSGVLISQCANPGAPILYGGSPAVFDMRYMTTPMGAIETMMIDCAYNEIGKHLGMPTQAYISMSDAKLIDAQAGLESGMGATLAALSGINSISGPGMIDFESCQSLEKLILDNEICGMCFRLIEGIEPKDDFPALGIFQELLKEQQLLTSEHTQQYFREEHHISGPIIDRANRERWVGEGSVSLEERAHREVLRLLDVYEPSALSEETRQELIRLMQQEARRYGQDQLPSR